VSVKTNPRKYDMKRHLIYLTIIAGLAGAYLNAEYKLEVVRAGIYKSVLKDAGITPAPATEIDAAAEACKRAGKKPAYFPSGVQCWTPADEADYHRARKG
jgi:hypothetical protein